jgi:hypothetical protein
MLLLAERAAALLVLTVALAPALAGEPEIRDFAVNIDGKPCGQSHTTVQPKDDGSTIITTVADVNIDRLLVHYAYSYNGTETWKDGKLVKLDSKTNDNGKRWIVSATTNKDGLKLIVNGVERSVRGDVWGTSYARYPNTELCDKIVPLLDVDSGRELTARLESIGSEEVFVSGQKAACTHFRLRGDVSVDLWYDGQKRLVRQELIEQGHKVLTELTGIRK